MKIFLSALENAAGKSGEETVTVAQALVDKNVAMKWNLMSYFYIRSKASLAKFIRDNTEEIMIDSGAHSFQKGTKVKTTWSEYTEAYIDFIKKFDRDNVIGYFEMDVDNILGYDEVLSMRKELEKVSDKIIPVWHKNRGIDDFKRMCEKYSGKIVAVSGFANEDIRDDQYPMFVKYAHNCGCKIHALGMTRIKILDAVPFDYTDSSSWSADMRFGKITGTRLKVTQDYTRNHRLECSVLNYLQGMKMQEKYYQKWKSVCKD